MQKKGKFLRRVYAVAIAALFILLCTISVSATDATNYTYTLSADGEWKHTQDAYLVSKLLLKTSGLSQPQDIFVKDDGLYIADTGNARILHYDIKTGDVKEYGKDTLSSPTGVFVANNGDLYAADNTNESVYVFSSDGKLINTYARPTTATFGTNTQYIPSKVAVNNSGILYIVSEGSYDGMVQLDREGNFLGYYGYNNNPMSVTEYLQDLFFTEEQKSQLFNRVPLSFYSLSIDKKGLIYTVTQSVKGNAVKKHDISGRNILSSDMQDEKNFVDIAVGRYGQIYAVTQTGLLFEYDTDGNLLFSLGGMAASKERSGLFTLASAVAADAYGNVYILDSERGLVHVLTPTDFAASVHTAMNLYNNGNYEESLELWRNITQISGNCRLVENSMANCYFQLQDYESAAKYYRDAQNRKGYSDAYWQIRNEYAKTMIPYILCAVVLVVVITAVYKARFRKNTGKKEKSKFEKDMLLIFKVVRHPVDSFYSIRREGAGSILSASVIYLTGLIVFAFNFIGRGFVASNYNLDNTSPFYVVLLFMVPLLLFVGCNFLVGEINESEGRFRDVYISTAYVMSPFIAIMPVIIAFSYFMTLSESRLLNLASYVVYVWIAVLLCIALSNIHAYGFWGVAKNLLITVFLMAVVVLAISLMGMFWDQIIDFISSVIKEVSYHAV